MSKSTIKTAIESDFATKWAASGLNPLPPVAYDNVSIETRNVSRWVRVNIQFGEERQVTMGLASNVFRRFGVVIIQIFVEPNSGAAGATQLADAVSNIFRAAVIDSIRFNGIIDNAVGLEVHGWYQYNVMCKFHVDESN